MMNRLIQWIAGLHDFWHAMLFLVCLILIQDLVGKYEPRGDLEAKTALELVAEGGEQ